MMFNESDKCAQAQSKRPSTKSLNKLTFKDNQPGMSSHILSFLTSHNILAGQDPTIWLQTPPAKERFLRTTEARYFDYSRPNR